MTPREITITTSAALNAQPHLAQQLWAMYQDSFPYEERRKPSEIVARLDEEQSDCPVELHLIIDEESLDEEQTLIAFALTYRLPSAIYIEYLCTAPHLRNGGIGTSLVKSLVRHYSNKPLILEAEPKGYSDLAERRLSFYQRHGFKIHDYPYLQPAYHDDTEPVALLLLSRGNVANISTLAQEIHRYAYRIYAHTHF